MESNTYEPHYYKDPTFPIIFHYDIVHPNTCRPHWHENLEILYITHGEPLTKINTEEVGARPGDIVVIPSNALHRTTCIFGEACYYCLIIDRNFCSQFGFSLDLMSFQKVIHDPELSALMDSIVKEFEEQRNYFQAQILSSILSLMVLLSRKHLAAAPPALNKAQKSQLDMVKRSFIFIEENYSKELTADGLAQHVGFNKFYFHHVFKELTGMTPISYINFVRCRKAKELLSSGRHNVGETAVLCGFDNMSYFSKTYKKYIGELPSETIS